jgi:hypothetical protein
LPGAYVFETERTTPFTTDASISWLNASVNVLAYRPDNSPRIFGSTDDNNREPVSGSETRI